MCFQTYQRKKIFITYIKCCLVLLIISRETGIYSLWSFILVGANLFTLALFIAPLRLNGLFAVNKIVPIRAVHMVKPVKPEDTPALFM